MPPYCRLIPAESAIACHVGQESVTQPGSTVDKVREELGKQLGADVKIDGFLRFAVGEGIEKKTDDLAAEVAKLTGG